MKLLHHIPSWLRNKYFISFCVFAFMMLFFDKNDFFTQKARTRELNALEKSKSFYQSSNEALKNELDQLKNDPTTLEKYAREHYLMKRENEEIFVIPEKE
ncbi:MAG: septum formation initiator family protein [Bacteroidia bacterium]|nr:septum formation initiator family protein [Bacteroidia bacterium]